MLLPRLLALPMRRPLSHGFFIEQIEFGLGLLLNARLLNRPGVIIVRVTLALSGADDGRELLLHA